MTLFKTWRLNDFSNPTQQNVNKYVFESFHLHLQPVSITINCIGGVHFYWFGNHYRASHLQWHPWECHCKRPGLLLMNGLRIAKLVTVTSSHGIESVLQHQKCLAYENPLDGAFPKCVFVNKWFGICQNIHYNQCVTLTERLCIDLWNHWTLFGTTYDGYDRRHFFSLLFMSGDDICQFVLDSAQSSIPASSQFSSQFSSGHQAWKTSLTIITISIFLLPFIPGNSSRQCFQRRQPSFCSQWTWTGKSASEIKIFGTSTFLSCFAIAGF